MLYGRNLTILRKSQSIRTNHYGRENTKQKIKLTYTKSEIPSLFNKTSNLLDLNFIKFCLVFIQKVPPKFK